MEKHKNYQARRRTNPARAIIWLVVVILLGLGAILLIKNLTTPSSTPAEESTSEEQSDQEEPAEPQPSTSSNVKNQQPTEEDEDPFHKTPVQNEGEDPNLLDELTGSINYSAASGSNLGVLVNIDQFLSSGTCTLTLTSSTYGTRTYTANIIANPSSSSCEGFSVPLTDLNGATSGTWHIHLRFTSGNKTGVVEGEVELDG